MAAIENKTAGSKSPLQSLDEIVQLLTEIRDELRANLGRQVAS